MTSNLLLFVSGPVAHAASARTLVRGASGLTLPYVATLITAALSGERDIAAGNAVGSSNFNMVGCHFAYPAMLVLPALSALMQSFVLPPTIVPMLVVPLGTRRAAG